MRQTFTQVVNRHFDEELGAISREMLLLWGEKDTATPLEQGRRLEKAMKGSALIELKGAGHYAFLDKPHEFLAIVRSYLSADSNHS
jgi:pimeloyl-ACP methyl ester carboxylesterase